MLTCLGLVLLPFVSAVVHDVTVGAAGKLLYDPEAIFANPGDQVVFHFHPKNHTVTQSSFADPCGKKDGGFASGFQPVLANQTDNFPTFTVTVQDTQPIWVYCGQAAGTPASHCGHGMVFAVNCGTDGSPNSFTNFKNAALAIGASLEAAASSTVPTAAAETSAASAYGGSTTPPTPTSAPASVDGQVHKVIVGGSKLVFDPPFISAQPHDTVVFEFHQKNHTVTQSSFDDPCHILNAGGITGFDSGFMPVAVDATTFPTWNFTVTDTSPVWAYCRQKTPVSHCGQGMVFAINSDETSARNFTAFQNIAIALNGTASAASASAVSASATAAAASLSTSTSISSAISTRLGSPGVWLVVVSLLFSLL